MGHRAFRRGAAAISAKRQTSWFELQPQRNSFSSAGGTILFSLTAAELALRPFTVVRTRLLVSIESDQLIADEIQIGALGLAVVSDQANAVGVTAVPTPITDMASDLWFVHQLMYNSLGFATAVGFNPKMNTEYVIDSKAMRKVDIGQEIVVVGELSAAGQGFTLTTGGRILIKVN